MQVEIETVLHRRAVHRGGEAAGMGKPGAVEVQPHAQRRQFRRCVARMPSPAAADVNAEFRRRERKRQKFKSPGSTQRFLARHASVHNTFNLQPHLISRPMLRMLRAQADRAREADRRRPKP